MNKLISKIIKILNFYIEFKIVIFTIILFDIQNSMKNFIIFDRIS